MKIDKINSILAGIPKKDLFRLFIDMKRQNEGEYAFDLKGADNNQGEKGYKAAMCSAFGRMFSTLGKPLDADELDAFHTVCVNNVNNMGESKLIYPSAVYDIKKSSINDEILKEWDEDHLIINQDEITKESKKDVTKYVASVISFDRHYLKTRNPKYWTFDEKGSNAKERINELLSAYYTNMDKEKDNDNKLSIIVSLIRKLEVAHFYRDGNQRTLVFVILNKLLLENDFPLCILDNPYVFDGYKTINDLVKQVKKGFQNVQSLKDKARDNDIKIKSVEDLISENGYFHYSEHDEKKLQELQSQRVATEKTLLEEYIQFCKKNNFNINMYDFKFFADNFNDSNKLHKAIKKNALNFVSYYLSEGVNPFIKDASGKTAFHAAAEIDDLSILKLMTKNKDINLDKLYDSNGNTVEDYAIAKYFSTNNQINFRLIFSEETINTISFLEKVADVICKMDFSGYRPYVALTNFLDNVVIKQHTKKSIAQHMFDYLYNKKTLTKDLGVCLCSNGASTHQKYNSFDALLRNTLDKVALGLRCDRSEQQSQPNLLSTSSNSIGFFSSEKSAKNVIAIDNEKPNESFVEFKPS